MKNSEFMPQAIGIYNSSEQNRIYTSDMRRHLPYMLLEKDLLKKQVKQIKKKNSIYICEQRIAQKKTVIDKNVCLNKPYCLVWDIRKKKSKSKLLQMNETFH